MGRCSALVVQHLPNAGMRGDRPGAAETPGRSSTTALIASGPGRRRAMSHDVQFAECLWSSNAGALCALIQPTDGAQSILL